MQIPYKSFCMLSTEIFAKRPTNKFVKLGGMNSYADRLNHAMNLIPISQVELARNVGIKQQSIQYLCSGKAAGSKHTAKIAQILGVRPQWLATGEGPMQEGEESNVSPGPLIQGKVPLISWVRAGEWQEVIDPRIPGDAEDWIETTVQVRTHTFALRVQGDSMEPDFPEGMLIVVEPELDPQSGDFVVVRNGNDATFKQLIKDGADWYLKPLNLRYPIKSLESRCKIIGVVREAVRRFR